MFESCRSRRVVVSAGVILACLITALCAVAADSSSTNTIDSRAPELQKELDAVVAAGVPGAVLIIRDGNQTLRLASGSAELAPKVPMRTTDRFRVGSITKTFVATVVLQLVGEGKLALSDTVESRLPGVLPHGTSITVRQLLNMTSGLFDYLNDGDTT